MVANLPERGMAVIVLGGSHDLGVDFDKSVLWVPRSYPD
jgi:hypothetical protein